MDTSALIRITGELPKEETIQSKLPPLLGPLPISEDNKKLSFGYSNVLELVNCKLINSVSSEEFGSLYLSHSYSTDIYANKYIQTDTKAYVSRPNPGSSPETVNWINMTYYQFVNMINNGWKNHFGQDKSVLEINNDKSVTLTLPSGVGLYLCHLSVWKSLGLFEAIKDISEAYTPSNPTEINKLKGLLTGKIAGVKNKSSGSKLVIRGTPLTYQRFNDQFPINAESLANDSSVIKQSMFYAIIVFSHQRQYYNEFAKYSFPLELIPFSSKFQSTFVNTVVNYASNILELNNQNDNTPTIQDVLKNNLSIVVENSKFMMIKVGKEYTSKQINIHLVLNKQVQKYLGLRSNAIDIRDGLILNPIDHNEIVMKTVFKYPLYLVLLSTDERSDFQISMIDNIKRNIIAIIYSESSFVVTQSEIRLRPSNFNKLVLVVLNNEFNQLTEKVHYDFLFRFRREFCENTTNHIDFGWI